jgi:hypothetical protein
MNDNLKQFEFTYYGWIPGYDDFDIDSELINALTKEDAIKIFNSIKRFIKHGPSIKEISK